MEAREIIKKCTITGKVVTLPPGQLERKLYQDVAKLLEGAGGAWNRKAGGFVFEDNPAAHLDTITGGGKVNIKKDFQFFETPNDIADWMVGEANIQPGQTILEPSAGRGALINAIRVAAKSNVIAYIEMMPLNLAYLLKVFQGAKYLQLMPEGDDFLKYKGPDLFDRIIANPPFSGNQDIDHILQMWQWLKPGGRLVSVSSSHWTIDKRGKKERDFRAWVDEVGAAIYPLDNGRFKSSGTMVSTQLLVIDKPAN